MSITDAGNSPTRRITASLLSVGLVLAMTVAAPGGLSAATGGDDPGDAPSGGGGFSSLSVGDTETFVDQQGNEVLRVADGHDLDQYLYHSSSPLDFAIDIEGEFGPVDQNGAPAPGNLLYGKDVRLTVRVFDVDDDYVGPDEPEVDQLVVNGTTLTEYLSGANNQWSINTFVLPAELLRLPTSQTPTVQNDFQILIDTANGGLNVWAVEVDWAELRLFDSSERPLVLLHGFNSNGDRLEPFEDFIDEAHPPLDGHIDRPTVGDRSSTESNAAALVEPIEDLLEANQSATVDVIAHSKGGLDTRRFIWDNEGVVENLVMIGTPNAGSELADISCDYQNLSALVSSVLVKAIIIARTGLCTSDSAVHQLTTSYVQDVLNRQVPDRPSTRYWTIAGTAGEWWSEAILPGQDDGTVSVQSVEWLQTQDTENPLPPTLHVPWDRYPEGHSGLVEEGSPAMPGALCIIRPVSCDTGAGGATTLQLLQAGDLVPSGDVEFMTVAGNDNESITLDFEQSSLASVLLLAEDNSVVSAELDNVALQPASFLGTDALSITADPPGAGVLEVSNSGTEPVDVAVLVAVESARQLSVSASETLAAPSASVDVEITVTETDTGDAPQLFITDGDGTVVDEPTPTSTGSGAWETTLDPLPGGIYTATAYLSGDRERFASTIFTVGSGAAELAGGFSESTPDDDSDGQYDAFVIAPTIDVTTAGSYQVTLTLEDGSGNPVAVSGGTAQLSTGTQSIPVRIEGSDLFASRTSGPYVVTDVVLSREEGGIAVMEHELATLGSTTTYAFDDFEHFPVHFDLDGFSDEAVDTDSDQDIDQLQVDGSVWVDTADTYLINARLLATDGTELAEFQTSTSLTAGDNSFQLAFPWQAIEAGGIDGPFTVADLSVYPSSSASVLGYLPVAHHTAAYEVIQAVEYSYDFSGPDEDPWETGWTHHSSDPQADLPVVDNGYGLLDSSEHGVVSLRPETITDSVQQLKAVFYDFDEDGYMSAIAARWRGTGYTDGSGYYCVFYYEDNDDDPILALVESTDGDWTWLDTEAIPVQGDTWLKCDMTGSTLRAKVWAVGTTEPSTWDLEETNVTHTSGRSGILLSGDRRVDILIDDYQLDGVEDG